MFARLIQTLFIVVFTTLLFPVKAETEPLLISYFKHPQINKYKEVIRLSYEDLGLSINYINIEGERAYKALNNGVTDAEMIIEQQAADKYPNIIVIQPSLVTASIILFCINDVPCSLDILEDPEQKIFVEQITANHLPETVSSSIDAELVTFASLDALTELFRRGRTKYAIYGLERGITPDKLADFRQVEIYHNNAYHAIHRKHQRIAPALSTAISKRLLALED